MLIRIYDSTTKAVRTIGDYRNPGTMLLPGEKFEKHVGDIPKNINHYERASKEELRKKPQATIDVVENAKKPLTDEEVLESYKKAQDKEAWIVALLIKIAVKVLIRAEFEN